MTINLKIPDIREMKPRITVFGVGGGVEPLQVIDENPKAAVNRAIVPARSRRGVSQVACWAWSHANGRRLPRRPLP